MTTTATIVHQNGSGIVEDFERIEEQDPNTLRVYFDERGPDRIPAGNGLFYEEYRFARIVSVDPSSDDDGNDGGVIQVDS